MSRIVLVLVPALALAACSDKSPSAQAAAPPDPGKPCLASAAPAKAPATTGMVLVKGGTFTQGAAGMRNEEGPPRKTTVGSFWIDRTEVTNAQFARFVKATGYVTLAEKPLDPAMYPGLTAEQLRPSAIVFVGAERKGDDPGQWWAAVQGADWRHPQGPGSSIEGMDDWPVVQIALPDALAYAKWLGRDIPTEAEWEFAARGGRDGEGFTWGHQPLDKEKPQANVWQGVYPAVDTGADGYKVRTAPVGCFPANGYGLSDMAGNVWEWTTDWYAPGLDPAQTDRPRGPLQHAAYDPADPREKKHVIKGGSFLCSDDFCYRYRPPARQPGPTDTGSNHVGFRTILRVAG